VTELRIEVRIPTENIRLADPCPIEVAIINEGSVAVGVNSRLAVGYRRSLHRELFVDIFRAGAAEPVGIETQLYDRAPARPADFRRIGPGDALRTSFDLFEWYSVPAAGRYELVVCYQADEKLAKPPAGTASGVHCSPRTALVVRG